MRAVVIVTPGNNVYTGNIYIAARMSNPASLGHPMRKASSQKYQKPLNILGYPKLKLL